LTTWDAVESGPFFELEEIPEDILQQAVPTDYLNVLREFGGREGFLGQQYLRLYRWGELIPLNQAYEMQDYNRVLFLFAADGFGEAFAFVFGTDTVVKIPLIPIPKDKADIVAHGFEAFLDVLAASGPPPEMDPDGVGLELHLVQPLCCGGDFTIPDNRVMVPPAKHAELTRFWNQVYYESNNQSEET
jgi:hypothetical protein